MEATLWLPGPERTADGISLQLPNVQHGQITAAGEPHEVEFIPIDDAALNKRIDAAYEQKYAGSLYLSPMMAAGPKAATVEVTRRVA